MAVLFWRDRHEVRDAELSAFVDGELDESGRLRVERHMESCVACRDIVAELQAVSRAMSELPAVPAPRSFALREADLDPEPASPGAGLFGSLQPLLGGVAAIAILAFVVLAGVDISSDSSQGDSSSALRFAGQMETLPLSGAERDDAADGGAAPAAVDDGTLVAEDADAFGDDEAERNFAEGDDGSGPELRAASAPPDEKAGDTLTLSPGEDAETNALAPIAGDEGSNTGLRVAEGVAAAVAMAAVGSVLLIWWRRRASTV